MSSFTDPSLDKRVSALETLFASQALDITNHQEALDDLKKHVDKLLLQTTPTPIKHPQPVPVAPRPQTITTKPTVAPQTQKTKSVSIQLITSSTIRHSEIKEYIEKHIPSSKQWDWTSHSGAVHFVIVAEYSASGRPADTFAEQKTLFHQTITQLEQPKVTAMFYLLCVTSNNYVEDDVFQEWVAYLKPSYPLLCFQVVGSLSITKIPSTSKFSKATTSVTEITLHSEKAATINENVFTEITDKMKLYL
jgi:hypothetical protein